MYSHKPRIFRFFVLPVFTSRTVECVCKIVTEFTDLHVLKKKSAQGNHHCFQKVVDRAEKQILQQFVDIFRLNKGFSIIENKKATRLAIRDFSAVFHIFGAKYVASKNNWIVSCSTVQKRLKKYLETNLKRILKFYEKFRNKEKRSENSTDLL